MLLYSTDTKLASVAALNMDDASDIALAAAMGVMIFYTNVHALIVHALIVRGLIVRGLLARTQAWR